MSERIHTTGGNNKLDMIVADKLTEISRAKECLPLTELRIRLAEKPSLPIRDFYAALTRTDGVALIAEIKKASPSVGDINAEVSIVSRAVLYERHGASALSVLTDAHFKGNIGYLLEIKKVTGIPILRKDFILDSYQVYESKYYGADAILLIASILSTEGLRELVTLTYELGLECLVEAHTREDIEKILLTSARIVGINARDLKTFEVDLENIVKLAPYVPPDRYPVAESAIETRSDVERVTRAGAKRFWSERRL